MAHLGGCVKTFGQYPLGGRTFSISRLAISYRTLGLGAGCGKRGLLQVEVAVVERAEPAGHEIARGYAVGIFFRERGDAALIHMAEMITPTNRTMSPAIMMGTASNAMPKMVS